MSTYNNIGPIYLTQAQYDALTPVVGQEYCIVGDLDASDIPSLDASKITSGTFADARIASASTWNGKSVVSASASGTSTDEVSYITVNGTEYKLAGGSSSGGTVTSVTVRMNDTDKGTVTTSGTIDLGTVITAHQSLSAYRTSADQDTIDDALDARLDTVEAVIPSQATSSNQLADKAFVNSSVATNTANYISNNGQPFNSVAELEAYSGTVTNNDYAFVTGTDILGNTYFDRYKATVSGSTVTWAKEYRLNNSSFTAAQWSAINSGLASSDKTSYDAHIADSTIHVTSADKTAWNAKLDSAVDDSSTTSTTLGWSASKLNTTIGNIESLLQALR